MTSGLRTVFLAISLTATLAGCSANTVMSHSSVIDHSSVHSTARDHNDISDDRGNLRKPNFLHVSVKGDASKVFVSAGQEHFQNQNYGLALENFEKAVEVSSDNASAWLGLAASLDQLGKFKNADRAYEQLIELKGNNARVYNNYGYSQLLRGDYSKARQYLTRAQEIDPTLDVVQGNIHLLEKTIQG